MIEARFRHHTLQLWLQLPVHHASMMQVGPQVMKLVEVCRVIWRVCGPKRFRRLPERLSHR